MEDMGVDPKEDSKKEHEEYEIDCAARDVLKAEEIKADASLWPKVQAKLKSQGEAIKKITSFKQLREVAQEKSKT